MTFGGVAGKHLRYQKGTGEAKMAGYWPNSIFCVFVDPDEVEVHKILQPLYGLREIFLRDTAGSPEQKR